jgi:hypothetical protein
LRGRGFMRNYHRLRWLVQGVFWEAWLG